MGSPFNRSRALTLHSMTPILILGAGRMGGAIAAGLAAAKAYAPDAFLLVDPHPGAEALDLAARGARLNPPLGELAQARTVVLAVKPQTWREAAKLYAPHLRPDATLISIAAGVSCSDLAAAFTTQVIARVMPTTAVAISKGVASIWSASEIGRTTAATLFRPLGRVVELPDERFMDAATAVSGSGPAYLYALAEAMSAAGVAQGLAPDAAAELARATLIGAAALMEASPLSPAELRAQVTSPGGTTAAALSVLQGEQGLPQLMTKAVAAAVARARDLG